MRHLLVAITRAFCRSSIGMFGHSATAVSNAARRGKIVGGRDDPVAARCNLYTLKSNSME
jgi:hypothetical protein